MLTLVLTVIIVALIFEYINGFHDTANAIATTVGTAGRILFAWVLTIPATFLIAYVLRKVTM